MAFEGGGVLGMSYVEPLRILDETIGLDSLRQAAGTSAGAITAMLIALGAKPDYIHAKLEDTPWHKFADDSRGIVRDLWRLIRKEGWHRLRFARDWLTDVITELGWPASLTFGELAERSDCALSVCAVNETTGKLQIFGAEGTEHVKVVDGVLASMAIPIFWPSVKIGDDHYSDGGLIANHPMDLLSDWLPEEILGLRIVTAGERRKRWPPARSIFGRAARLLRIAMDHANRSHIPRAFWSRIVSIHVNDGLRATDFDLSSDDRQRLLRAGRASMDRWIAWQAS